jgi:hypothetical protein
VELLIAMDLADGDEGIRLERTRESRDRILWMHLRAHRTLRIGC